jgi:hypothetical protein
VHPKGFAPLYFYNSSALWSQETLISPETSNNLKEGLIESFNRCDYFFVPSKIRMWNQDNPYQLYKALKLFEQELSKQTDQILISSTLIHENSYILLFKKTNEKQN